MSAILAAVATQAKLNIPPKNSVFDTDTDSLPGIHTQLVNEFYLTPHDIKQLQRHFIRHWTGFYVSSLLSINQTITHDGIEYIPVFQKCSRTKLLEAPQLKLSFRKHLNPTIPPYVLIRIL